MTEILKIHANPKLFHLQKINCLSSLCYCTSLHCSRASRVPARGAGQKEACDETCAAGQYCTVQSVGTSRSEGAARLDCILLCFCFMCHKKQPSLSTTHAMYCRTSFLIPTTRKKRRRHNDTGSHHSQEQQNDCQEE